MKDGLKSIIIGTENLETIEIPARDVESFLIDGITKYITNDYWDKEKTNSGENATLLHLVLKPEADRRLRERYNANTVFERLTKFGDITNISLVYEDSCRDISIHWHNPDTENIINNAQTTAVCRNGCLYVCIEDGHTAEEYAKTIR